MGEALHLLPAARGLAVPFSQDLESLRAMASRLATLVDSVQAGVLVEDEECRILLVNRAFCEMFTLPETPDELVGWETRTMLGWTNELFVDRDGFFPRIGRVVTERLPVLSEELALVDGRTFERDYIPVFTGGDYQGHFWVFRDITGHKRHERELRRTAERLELSNRRLEAANRDLAVANRALERNNRKLGLLNEMGDLLQTAREPAEGVGVIRSAVPQIFMPFPGAVFLVGADRASFERVVSWGRPYPAAACLKMTDCWALRRGRPHLSGPDAGAGDAGPACPHVAGTGCEGSLCVPLMAQGRALGLLHLVEAAPTPGGGPKDDLASVRHLALNTAEQLALGLVNLELRESLREQALHDCLTGLYNRRCLEERFDQELRRARRSGSPVAVLLLDLDHFKEVNDEHGHAAGDVLLARFAKLLQETVRADDVVARYGGEEFTVILPGAGAREALKVAEKVRRRTQRLSIEAGERRLGEVTVSIGVAFRPDCGEAPGELLAAADRALYRAKREGRNRVVVADPAEVARPAAVAGGRGRG